MPSSSLCLLRQVKVDRKGWIVGAGKGGEVRCGERILGKSTGSLPAVGHLTSRETRALQEATLRTCGVWTRG